MGVSGIVQPAFDYLNTLQVKPWVARYARIFGRADQESGRLRRRIELAAHGHPVAYALSIICGSLQESTARFSPAKNRTTGRVPLVA